MAPNIEGSITLSEQVYTQIRVDILSGRHKPGEPMRLAALAKSFNVSAAVIREVLIRLAERNLLVLAPNQGFRVVNISRRDLIDLTDMRILLMGRALRQSIEKGGVDWEAEVVSAHHVLDRTQFRRQDGAGSTDEWARAHAAFHAALGSACGNGRLIQLTHLLWDSSELYRQLSATNPDEKTRDAAHEHRVLMELAINRKADEAVAALTAHFQRTTDLVLGHALAQ